MEERKIIIFQLELRRQTENEDDKQRGQTEKEAAQQIRQADR